MLPLNLAEVRKGWIQEASHWATSSIWKQVEVIPSVSIHFKEAAGTMQTVHASFGLNALGQALEMRAAMLAVQERMTSGSTLMSMDPVSVRVLGDDAKACAECRRVIH